MTADTNAHVPEQKFLDIITGNRIDIAATLPCDRIKALLPLIADNIRTIPLTREENGVGICAGVYLGGLRPLMIIQSTGLGNMINALFSLNLTYGIPLPIIASWRGVYKESIEAQWHFGKRLPDILKAAKIKFTVIDSSGTIERLDAAIKDSFNNSHPHVILVSPAVWENSTCEVPEPVMMQGRKIEIKYTSTIREPLLSRYDAISTIVETIGDDKNAIIISNLGVPSKELFEIKDRDLNFYMMGSMGLVSSIGLGLAIAQKRHVYVIDGDGSLLMNPNALISAAEIPVDDLTIIAIDNASYGSTGNQPTCTQTLIDLELLAKACGISDTAKVHSKQELSESLLQNKDFIHVIVKPFNAKCKEIPFSAKEIKERFMKALKKEE